MKLAWIPPGDFVMGSPATEKFRGKHETQHKVKLTKGFFMGSCMVTRGQFAEFVRDTGHVIPKGAWTWQASKWWGWPDAHWTDPGYPQTDEHPVVCVSWHDCEKFCRWLSRKEGVEYRLPTEAEFEYACRAGTTTRFWFGDTIDPSQANYRPVNGAHPPGSSAVDKYPANPWNLHDMHGNVFQWCADWYADDLVDATDPKGPARGEWRVLRGGSFGLFDSSSRAAHRFYVRPDHRDGGYSFRVARSAR